MASSEHVLVRMGVAGRFVFLGLTLALVGFAVFCVTFAVDLRCEHVGAADLLCSSRSHSLLHDSEETVVAMGVQEVKTELHLFGSHRSRPETSLELYAVTESETVHIPIANGAFVFPETKRAIATELDSFVKAPDAAPYSRVVEGEPIVLSGIASLMLFFPLALWLATKNTLVAVDRHASTVTISRRRLGFATSRVVVPLGRAVTVMGRPKRRGQDLFLQLTQGEPLHIEWVPHRRAVADFAALKRLFPLDGGIS